MAQYSTGGYTMTPMGPQIDPRLPVYRPEIQKGLLSDTKAQDLIKNFAGGLLGGYQVNATPNKNGLLYQPTNPSGVYTAEQTGAPDSDPNAMQGGSGMTLEDVLRMRGMGNAQFTAAGLPQIGGDMMVGQGAYTVGMPGSSPMNATQAASTSLGTMYDPNNPEHQAIINSLLNYTPGE